MEKVTVQEFEEKIVAADEESIIIFSAEWCGPCKVLSKMIGNLDPQNKLRVYKIDVDSESDLTTLFNVKSVPSVFKVKEGVTIDSFVGVPQQKTLREFLGIDEE